jgi:hypothetical protein
LHWWTPRLISETQLLSFVQVRGASKGLLLGLLIFPLLFRNPTALPLRDRIK